MKNIKRLTSIAGSVLCALLANPVTAMAAEEKRSFGETMQYALLNTVMGISIVFVVLLLISWIIGLFKYIGKIEAKLAAKKNKTAEPAKVETPAAAVAEEELSDDLELVAVITAAIHAYEEAQGNNIPADGLVVRSIRKVNKAKWQNA